MKTVIIRYIINRLTEASTIRGIVLGIGSFVGYNFSSQQTDSLVWVILGIVGFVGTFIPDLIRNPSFETSDGDNQSENPALPSDQPGSDLVIPKPKYREKQPTTESGWGDR